MNLYQRRKCLCLRAKRNGAPVSLILGLFPDICHFKDHVIYSLVSLCNPVSKKSCWQFLKRFEALMHTKGPREKPKLSLVKMSYLCDHQVSIYTLKKLFSITESCHTVVGSVFKYHLCKFVFYLILSY